MTPEPLRPRSRLRTALVAGALGLATAAGALVATTPAIAATPSPTPTPTTTATATPKPVSGTALAIDLAPKTVLTLPATDGLRDRTTVRVRSGASGRIDVDAIRGTKTVHLGTGIALTRAKTGWAKTVAVRDTKLAAGTWRIRVRRSSTPAVEARSGTFAVGSGAPRLVLITPNARTLYPYKDGSLDTAIVTVVAQDETRTAVPVTGTIRIDAGKKHVTRKLSAAGIAKLPITALPIGGATMTTTVKDAAGSAVRHTALTLAPTAVGSLRIARSSDTVQPVIDGLLDSVVLTTTGLASGGSKAKVSGTLTITNGKTVAAMFPVADGTQRAFTWDGRVNGVVVPGTYTVTLSLKGPQGLVKTKTKTLLVTKTHLNYAVRDMFTVAAGNQQGLAVHAGVFYVGYDNGDGTSRIEEYNPLGTWIGTMGPLSIGHAAELSYSTTTNLLYAANGGPTTPTTVWSIDPATGTVHDTYDLSALGPNGMVAVDDVGQRLMVFAGSATAGYTITPVALQLASTTDPDTGVTTTSPVVGQSMPISITGTPQGVELVGQQLWVYTSLKKMNHIAKYDVSTMAASAAAGSNSDLMSPGEGEGLAYEQDTDGSITASGLPGWMYVGTHAVNRISLLVPVTDND